jgi:DNA-binding transcriptional LysR family regulator
VNLENVRAFVKVAELRSFTRAAEHLRLSKARVSAQVRDLEAEVGGRLLQRSTRSVRLTSDGEQFLVRARRLVGDADELSAMRAICSYRGCQSCWRGTRSSSYWSALPTAASTS